MQRAVLATALVMAGLLASVPAELRGAECVWQGEASQDWGDPGNWSSEAVPTEADMVTVNTSPECVISAGEKASVKFLFLGHRGSGPLSVAGEDSSLTAEGTIAVGSYSRDGSGVLTQKNGTINGAAMSVGSASGEATYLGAGGALNIKGGLSLGGGGSKGTFLVEGANVSVGDLVYNGSGSIKKSVYGYGVVTITSGSLKVGKTFFNGHHMWSMPESGKKVRGKLRLSGGKLEVAGDFYNGFGQAGTAKVEGVVEVVGNAGEFIVQKGFVQGEGSSLIAELSGEAHTVIQVEGHAELGGIFKVRLAEGYTPNRETWWDIIKGDIGSPVGTFTSVDFSETADPENWTIAYDTDECVFRVGYIPATE